MNQAKDKQLKRDRRRNKIRSKISGTGSIPRLSVFRSNDGMFLQLIDDTSGKTLASAGSHEVKKGSEGKIGVSLELGKIIAKKAQDAGIKKVVFDRGGYQYHGRVKAAAEGAREGGLEF
ncbi:MAG: Ribosomal protein L18 [Parcubacteria group bacterium GW2011_GWE2_39_37]|uniref:Large ribosomal subunit protein uL18 n=1 Tax=Candidatus Falkowbacteria bacterium GW2011_GWF2_39_8 TaxID=1618642 RepID=A0A0G0Q3J4_9BACT|nr:MAG: Ribosomal protein L18 [Parcubacteria group bacterium GW2011_GWE2_39_37]KKR31956.1 MAG: Ribosomal protein L18 [Candidatus Falkowbacteria bacterium GW2011_GWF2_39_8]